MSKTCLNKLSGNILVGCDLPTHGIKDLYLMYVEDVTLAQSDDSTTVSSVTWAKGAKSYRIEGYKQNIQVTTSMLNTDASAKLDVTIQFKAALNPILSRRISTGKFFVMVVPPSGAFNSFWGLQTPLECTGIEYDSNANGGLATYTLSAPEGSVGNYFALVSEVASKSIISKSV